MSSNTRKNPGDFEMGYPAWGEGWHRSAYGWGCCGAPKNTVCFISSGAIFYATGDEGVCFCEKHAPPEAFEGPGNERTPAPEADQVNHPSHYTSHPSGIECIQITEHMGFCLGNAVKYIWRAGLKSPDAVKDLEKARWCIDREIARLKGAKG